MTGLTIGTVARRAGVGVETIRFYEREGLLPEPPRTGAGYRKYPEETIERLRFIRRAKELGFSLAETEELIELRLAAGADRSTVKEVAERRLADIRSRIGSLLSMEKALARLTEACDGEGSVEGCSIIAALSGAPPAGARRPRRVRSESGGTRVA